MTDTPPETAPLSTDEQNAYVTLVASDPTDYTITDLVTWLNGATLTPAKLVDWLNTLSAGERYAWIIRIRYWLNDGA